MTIKFLEAHNGDSILIRYRNEAGNFINVLIDGGTSQTYYESRNKQDGQLKVEINNIRDNGEKINLLILTHIDDDHIAGLLRWFEDDASAIDLIENIWFNSGKLIANYFNDSENVNLNIVLANNEGLNTSITQGVDFVKYASESGRMSREIIKSKDLIIYDDLKFYILSPDDIKLKKLLKEWVKKDPDFETSTKGNDYSPSLKEHVQNDSFSEDTAYSNGSSFAFIIEYKTYKLLFLGDAHPSIIVDSLKHFGFSESNKLNAYIVKLSHHGSKFNNSPELLDLICAEKFVISTNGELHNHPHKALLARLVSKFDKCEIIFNYPELAEHIFSDKDHQDYPNFKINTHNKTIEIDEQ